MTSFKRKNQLATRAFSESLQDVNTAAICRGCVASQMFGKNLLRHPVVSSTILTRFFFLSRKSWRCLIEQVYNLANVGAEYCDHYLWCYESSPPVL